MNGGSGVSIVGVRILRVLHSAKHPAYEFTNPKSVRQFLERRNLMFVVTRLNCQKMPYPKKNTLPPIIMGVFVEKWVYLQYLFR